MTDLRLDAPPREHPPFADRSWIQRVLRALRPNPKPHFNDHIARDIGLRAHDIEHLRHSWPSQTTHHPRW